MLLSFILFFISLFFIIVLLKEIRKPHEDYYKILPECKFVIGKPSFEIDGSEKIAKFDVLSKNKDRYFRDFPIGFKFYSNDKFRSKIRIIYKVIGDDETEVIYDKLVFFEDHSPEHIYYINDVIIGGINIEIYTNVAYGNPMVSFEILQNNLCHMSKDYKLEIKFPE